MDQSLVVRRWMPNGRKITYKFGNHGDISIPIFQDDTIERALAKIAVGIHAYHEKRNEPDKRPSLDVAPYAWHKRRSVRFAWALKDNQKTIPANPWQLETTDAKAIADALANVKYFDADLLGLSEIDIAFREDVPVHLSQHPAYFPDVATKWKLPSLAALTKETAMLEDIWNAGENKDLSLAVTKARFVAKLPQVIMTRDVFESTSVSSKTPFMQLVEDVHKIMYKLYEHHTIPLTLLQSWTAHERVPKVPSLIVMYPMQRNTLWARLCIEESGMIMLTYSADVRDNMKWDDCYAHMQKVKMWLEQLLKTKVAFALDDINVRTEFIVQSMSLQHASKHLGAIQPVFHVLRMQEGVLEVACKRSKNYRQRLDILDFIQSRMKMGASFFEIQEDLTALGLTSEDIAFWKSQVLMMEDAQLQGNVKPEAAVGRKKVLSQTGCMIHLAKSSIGFRAYILHAASLLEVTRIFRWVNGALQAAAKALPNVAPQKSPKAQPDVTSPNKTSPAKTQDAADEEEIENVLDQDDLDGYLGGALGKDYQRYFNNQLASADPAVFLETPLYSRKCAANNFRQPIVMTLQEKEALDKTEFKDSHDGAVTFGSDSTHQNVYMCPRIWCPMSRIPLTEAQLKAHNGKCPGPHHEKPMMLYDEKYWDSSPNTPKYIGFLKEKSPKGFCLPCCFKKPMKDALKNECVPPAQKAKDTPTVATKKSPVAETSSSAQKKAQGETAARGYKEETYIMGAPAPLPPDRYGAIPQDLHHLLLPNVAYNTCTKSINSTACFVRRGVGIDDDSFMKALALAIGLAGKDELIKFVKKRLDPLTFISLENGHVLRAFASPEPIDPSLARPLHAEWKQWLRRWPSYASRIGDPNVSRELAIFQAYRNFILHLQSADPKNPQHLFDFFRRQGIAIVLWKKEGMASATTLCPYFTEVESMFKADNVVMLLQEGTFVEHVELKARGQRSVALHPISEMTPVTSLLKECPVVHDNRDSDVIALMKGLRNWMETVLQDPKRFAADAIILRPDLTIMGLRLQCGLVVLMPPNIGVGVLPDVVKIFGDVQLIHQGDVENARYNVKQVFQLDVATLGTKLQSIGFGLLVGALQGNDPSSPVLNSVVTIPATPRLMAPAILTSAASKAVEWVRTNRKRTSRWDNLRRTIGTILVTYYDTLVAPLLKKDRHVMVTTLMNTFPKIPEKHMVQTLLEEMPLRDGKESLVRWLQTSHLEARTRIFYETDVMHKGKQWIFSQAAIESSRMPWHLVQASAGPKPSSDHTPRSTVLQQKEDTNAGAHTEAAGRPYMLTPKNCEPKDLPSKFSKIRQLSWSKYKIQKCKQYTSEHIHELVAWMSKQVGFPLTWQEVREASQQLVYDMLSRKEWIMPLLEDPSFVATWKTVFSKKVGTKRGEAVWNDGMAEFTPKQRQDMWKTKLAASSSWLPGDVDWYIVSKVLGINILVIHRTKYGKATDTEFQRADLEDQSMSSYVIVADERTWEELPCILLYRDLDATQFLYYPIVSDKNVFLHKKTKFLEEDIQGLFKYHLKHRGAWQIKQT